MRSDSGAYAEELGRATAAPVQRGAAERRLGASVAARRRGPGAGTTRLAASAVRPGSGADAEELGRATTAPMRWGAVGKNNTESIDTKFLSYFFYAVFPSLRFAPPDLLQAAVIIIVVPPAD